MSQATVVLPTSGFVSGVTFATDANNAYDAIRTLWSGASAPSADTPEAGQQWLDTGTSVSYYFKRIYDGTNWLIQATIDPTNHIWIPPVGGGQGTVASATTTTLGGTAAPWAAIAISGTTTITSFGSAAIAGQVFFLTFQGVLTLTYNATSLILPGKANITSAANDMAIAQYLGSGNWQILVYQPYATLVGSVGTVTGAFITNNVITPSQITSNQNDYAPSGNANAYEWELNSDGLSDYLITGIQNGVSGRHIQLRNTNSAGGGRFYLVPGSTLSASGNRFSCQGAVQINPNQSISLIYDNSVSAWVPQNILSAQPVVGARKNLQCGTVPGGGLGFTAGNAGQSTLTYTITADALQLSDVDGNTVLLQSVNVTANITSTGANGLDTFGGLGQSSKQWYSGWVIYNAITNQAAALLSTKISSPTLPSGYTFKARVGWCFTDSNKNLVGVYQSGNDAMIVPSSNNPIFASGSTVANYTPFQGGTEGTQDSPNWEPAGLAWVGGVSTATLNFAPPTVARIKFVISNTGSVALANGSSLNYQQVGGFNTSAGGVLPPVPVSAVSGSPNTVYYELTPTSTNYYYYSANAQNCIFGIGWVDNL